MSEFVSSHIDWPSLNHAEVRQLLEDRGWRLLGSGDWARALVDNSGEVVARISAFEPAYGYFVDLCRRLAGNPWLPRIHLATELEGGGHLALMERLRPRDLDPEGPDAGASIDPLWCDPSDPYLRKLKQELENLDAMNRAEVPWWGGLDLKPDHFMIAADARLKLVDPLYVAGEQLYAAARDNYPEFCRIIPPERHRYLLQIAIFDQPDVAADLPALRQATGLP
ncbi:hypothetical protein FOE78_15400 [Microlunatus elymi]|uniref:Uncharacterized protein n=1 Tax=Microlunatus elymi TaxID=2596828 RepID=A0A516Q134_9ACTN|nr:hypothetical protein [Microlunatus elymi]QDP97127.1 hypothetical protein FOE78_15400 [Microlunatus elymi]